MSILPACVWAPPADQVHRGQQWASDALEPELDRMSHDINAENQTLVLWRSALNSQTISPASNFKVLHVSNL